MLLERLRVAPVKPRVKFHILRCYALPKLVYHLLLDRSTKSKLKEITVMVGKEIKTWFHLPNNTPNQLLFIPFGAGGLGLPDDTLFIPNVSDCYPEKDIEVYRKYEGI